MGVFVLESSLIKENNRTFSLEINSVVDIAQSILSKRKYCAINSQGNEEKPLIEILKIATLAGGARPKMVIAYYEIKGEVVSGQTNAPLGFEHWLIKLEGVSDVQLGRSIGYCRVEMAYFNMAIDCGIAMMPSRLLEENGRAHFMTKRFDRKGGQIKHHIQTFCAIKHFDFNLVNSFSYSICFKL